MRNLVIFLLVVAFSIVAISGSNHTATAQAQATLEGTVTVNGDPAPANVGLVAILADGTECDDTVTKVGGTFTMSLITKCVGEPVFFRLAVTEDQTTAPVTIEAGAQTVDIAFEGLSDESLQAIGAGPTAIDEEAEAAVEEALEEAGAPVALITGTSLFWLVLAVSIGGMALLLCMVGAKVCQPLLLSCCKKRARGEGADDQNEPNEGDRKAQELTYRRQIEGMILIMVIVAIIILGVSEKIGDQGLISVLAAIVGYAAGRATAGG